MFCYFLLSDVMFWYDLLCFAMFLLCFAMFCCIFSTGLYIAWWVRGPQQMGGNIAKHSKT